MGLAGEEWRGSPDRAVTGLAGAGRVCCGGCGMMEEPTADRVVAMLREEGIADVAMDFDANGNLFEAGMDSMAVMQLIVVVEERFGVVISPAEAGRENLETPAALARLIGRKLA